MQAQMWLKGLFYAVLNEFIVMFLVMNHGNAGINVLFGTAAKARERDYPRNGYTPEKDRQTSEITGLEFFNIKDTPELRAALKKN